MHGCGPGGGGREEGGENGAGGERRGGERREHGGRLKATGTWGWNGCALVVVGSGWVGGVGQGAME
jgi:hypothetical protein